MSGYVLAQSGGPDKDISLLIDAGLNNISLKGPPQLQQEECEVLENRPKRTDKSMTMGPDYLQFGISVDKGPCGGPTPSYGTRNGRSVTLGTSILGAPSAEN